MATSSAELAAPESLAPLLRDLLEWLGPTGRPYTEVIEAWRTSCPRLPVWETANELGLVVRARSDGRAIVRVTELGHDFCRRKEGYLTPLS